MDRSIESPQLQQFGRNIWIADGPNVRDMGLLFTTRMTVVRLSDGSLWVESPVALSPDVREEINRMGPVRYIVASTQRHIWRLAAWHELYPNAQVWAPRNVRLAVGKAPSTANDLFTDTPATGWKQDLEQVAFKGSSLLKEVAFFHAESRTVIMGDLIQANPIMKGHPFRNALITVFGVAHPNGGVPPDIRLSFKDRELARQSLDRILSWDFDQLIIAHGACVERGAKSHVRDAFHWLLR